MTAAPRPPRPERLRPRGSAVLALGSNLGDREATLRSAVAALGAAGGIRVVALSHLVETPAIKLDGVDRSAPAYLNAVALVETVLDPLALLGIANAIEAAHGRTREERWGDRTLDIDVIDYDGRIQADGQLTLPHPRAAERAFVLAPWLEVAPQAAVPGRGTVGALRAAATDEVAPYVSESWDRLVREVREEGGAGSAAAAADVREAGEVSGR
ncbi:2-amino-4-hydroxy-6-hydroxymethyldihydropteridine diphosphokinase [Microbacterium sp. STN6]|uniref:2-amino-4-hydroxy-6- hydroxymethyldihydropteridine diphosphokinase n=1 Tax=Microbacterium sp. STN6 TaxID=2995588 RepID=UPI002260AFA9|nr:2-amino-4-hydroxy-6-hydroxymethyldihydropteridine diphosphokinase [Microbacterium sp. STN6]MCX7523061.1 2-amino-4-hydroxy-6-hydroxymethyldihydropteridine diphosphokinase [Microbacterium sp. STN6]